MTDSFDAASYDSRWKNDGLGWHGRHDGDAEPTEQSVFEAMAAKVRFYVGSYACGDVCTSGSMD